MIKVDIVKQSNYPVDTPALRKKLKDFFSSHGIFSDAYVEVAFVGEKMMTEISEKYLGDIGKMHTILSFPGTEVKEKFFYPDDMIRLGEIVVCYPAAFAEARKEGKLIKIKINELLEHGAMHLLGIHHD